jgi:O-acetyl-ADP-ribose deacetylase (regulator of RNase III)
MSIVIQTGDITKIACQALVNPANSYGLMGGGVAGALKKAGGVDIEVEAMRKAPIPLGGAIATTAGILQAQYIIHAPTMQRPAMPIPVENVEHATRAAFQTGQQLGVQSIAFPGMGTGVGGISETDAARVMIAVCKEFESIFETIILIDRNHSMVEAFHRFLDGPDDK